MKTLSLDTSTKRFSLAVSNDSQILASRNIQLKGVLSSSMIPSIKEILKKARLSLSKLDGFAIGLGPGSFTSLRVGVSTIKALSFATNKPVVGISSLDVIAMNVAFKPVEQICVLCDAKRGLLYSCVYQKKEGQLNRKSDYLLIKISDLLKKVTKKTLFVGDGIGLFYKQMEGAGLISEEKYWYPDASKLAILAFDRFKKKKFDNSDKLIPLYLYPADCQVGKGR